MSKKRYLLIPIVLLLGSMILFGIEQYRIYATCRDELSSSPIISGNSRDLKYEYTIFLPGRDYPPITVFFSYRGHTAFCHVRRNGLVWEVDDAEFLLASPYP